MGNFLNRKARKIEDEKELKPAERKNLQRSRTIEESDEEENYDGKVEVEDLIDDVPNEKSVGEDSDESRSHRKRKMSDKDYDDRLEDDDDDLTEENLGNSVERKRFKRSRKIQDRESDEKMDIDGAHDHDAITNELFEGGSSDAEKRRGESCVRDTREILDEDESGDDYSKIDDFIVNDAHIKRKPVFSDAAIQDNNKYDNDDGQSEKRRQEKQKPRKNIFDFYKPIELKKDHSKEIDNEIQSNDIPERMQLRSLPATSVEVSSDELNQEAEWIYYHAFSKPTISIQTPPLRIREIGTIIKGPEAIPKIKIALHLMRNSHFDVPFIAFYRSELIEPELNFYALWKIYKFDAKWCQFVQRKRNIFSLFREMKLFQKTKNLDDSLSRNSVREIKDDDIEQLKDIQTNEEVNDVYMHFMLYYSQDIPAMRESVRKHRKEIQQRAKIEERRQQILEAEENGRDPPLFDDEIVIEENEYKGVIKQAVRNGRYALCKKAGLDSFVAKFGLTPKRFGENVRDNYQRYEIDQDPTEPTEVAQNYICNNLKTTEDVLKAVQLMVATQLSREPLVRKTIRDMYMKQAKVSVKPTKLGLKMIDETHPLYAMKYLKDKPVSDFIGDQFLKLSIAEQDKLITITLSDTIEGTTSGNYVDELKQLYVKNGFSRNVREWNNLRVACVERALNEMIIPALKKELKMNLIAEAKESIMKECSKTMYEWLNIAPYSCEISNEEDDEWNSKKGIRVMAISYVPDYNQAAFACIVSPDGECTDNLLFPHFLERKNSFSQNAMIEASNLKTLKEFILEKKPHVIAIAGETIEATMISADIEECIKNLVETKRFPQIQVEICENNLAKIYSNSNRGKDEFPDYPVLLREAISLARRLQDPLAEFSLLCTSDEEILCLRYHPLQEYLSKEELLESLYQEFINRVNEVGVDINRLLQQKNAGNLLQFVSGLGPKKSADLIKTLKQKNQRLENRTQLVTVCNMGPKVFVNCAGFIKIDTNRLGNDSPEDYVQVLDGSRIHPEAYEYVIDEIFKFPEWLIDMYPEKFANKLKREGYGDKLSTVYNIRLELIAQYEDFRVKYKTSNPYDLFEYFIKASFHTLYTGKKIEAVVVGFGRRKPQKEQIDQAKPVRNFTIGLWQCPFCLTNDFPELANVWNHLNSDACSGKITEIKVKLKNGIPGHIKMTNLSDERVDNPEDRVRPGQTVHCRIIEIDVERFNVECTSKSSDLADVNHEWRPPKDPFYDEQEEEKDIQIEKESRMVKSTQVIYQRVIDHPSFKNIKWADAEKMLQSMDSGEAIVRPSSKAFDHLTVTWKVTKDVYQHIDIKEVNKPNAYTIGKELWIGNEKFEEIEEILQRYIYPMARYVTDIIDYKYYESDIYDSKEKAEVILKERQNKNPAIIPYIISASKNYPGFFLLSYLPRHTVYHEYIKIKQNGFQYCSETFHTLLDLIDWFKYQSMSTSRTPGFASRIDHEAIQRDAKNLPHHMLRSSSKTTKHTLLRSSPYTLRAKRFTSNALRTPYKTTEGFNRI